MKFSTRVLSATPAGAGAYCAIRSNLAANKYGARPRISRIACIVRTAAQADIDLYRVPNTNYGTQNQTQAGQALQGADAAVSASGATVDYGWSAPPSLPGGAVPLDGTRIAGTIGAGYIFVFPDPIILEPDTALLVWSPGVGPQLVITPTWDE